MPHRWGDVTEMQKMKLLWTKSDVAGLSNVPFRLIVELRDSREELVLFFQINKF